MAQTRWMTAVAVVLVLFFSGCGEKNTEAIKEGQTAALAWLALVDQGKYEQSWDEAAELFKHMISRERWVETMKGARPTYGKVVSRELERADYKTSLAGAPDGQFVVIQYQTKFEKKKRATETITPMLDQDGKWRVSGYYVK